MANDSEDREAAGSSKLDGAGQSRDGAMKLLVQVEKLIQLALMLPVATVVGWLIGAGLDKWLHQHWIYIPGLILGIAAGFIQLIRQLMRDTRNDGS